MKKLAADILSILNPAEKKSLLYHCVLTIMASLLDILFIGWLLLIVNIYSQTSHLEIAFIPEQLTDKGTLLPAVAFVVLFGLKNAFGFFSVSSQSRFIYGVASRISADNLRNYFHKSYTQFVDTDSSVNIRRISNQPIEFCQYVLSSFQEIMMQSMLILFTVTAILLYNAPLFLILFAILVPPLTGTAFLLKKRSFSLRSAVKSSSQKTIQHLQEALSSYVESNVYGSRDFFTKRYIHYQRQLNSHISGQQIIQNIPSRLMETFAVLGFLILLIISRITTTQGSLSLINIGVFLSAAYKIIPGVVKILNSSGQIRAYEFTVADLLKEKNTGTETGEPAATTPLVAVDFINTGFRYHDRQILRDFNLSISSGDFIGITGASGAGKSTLINLLLGFLEPSSGSIQINYVPAGSGVPESYRPRIAYVKQQSFLIHADLEKNITLSEERCCKKKLDSVLEISGLTNFVTANRGEMIRQDGKNISGGQRQRIAIARALYKNADLIILDEAFNELDLESERLILHHFKELTRQGKIVILISHGREGLAYCSKLITIGSEPN